MVYLKAVPGSIAGGTKIGESHFGKWLSISERSFRRGVGAAVSGACGHAPGRVGSRKYNGVLSILRRAV
jgi:hypothetical protein